MSEVARKTDGQIRSEVLHELDCDAEVGLAGLTVGVDGGVVTLTGNVESAARRHAAQEAAHRVEGVLDVANEIIVRPIGSLVRRDAELARSLTGVRAVDDPITAAPAMVSASEVRRRVSDALTGLALGEARDLEIGISEGRVALAGRVHSWAERQAALAAAGATPGVSAVVDYLHVETGS